MLKYFLTFYECTFSVVETSREETKINKPLTERGRRRDPKELLRKNFRNETSVPPYCFKHSRVI